MSRQTSDKEKRARKNYASDDPSSAAAASNPQAAYRARQKNKLPGLEGQVAELEAKLTALRLERERNKQRLAALSEKVASKIPARPPAPAPKAEPAPFSDAGPLLSRQPAAQGTAQLSEAGAAAIAALLAMLRGPDDPAAQPSACGSVTVASLCDLYMENIRCFGHLLSLGAQIDDSPAQHHLAAHIRQFQTAFGHVWEHHTGTMQQVCEAARRRGSASGLPVEHLPQAALAAMQLSEGQQGAIVEEYRAMLRRFARMLDDEALPLPTRVPDMSRPIPPSTPGHEPGLSSRDVEGIAQEIMRDYTWRANAVLGPLAMARGLVAVAPRFLDVLQIGAHLVARHGGVSKWSLEPADTSMVDVLAWLQADGASAGQAMSIASFSDLMSRDESGDLADYRPPRDPLRRAADELLQARTLALANTPMMAQAKFGLDPVHDFACRRSA